MQWRRPNKLGLIIALCISGTLVVLGAVAILVHHLDSVGLANCISVVKADPMGAGPGRPSAICGGWTIYPSLGLIAMTVVILAAALTASVILVTGFRSGSASAAASTT